MNICPTYGVVGGHAFGYIYPGPIGIPWTASVHGLAKAGEFAQLCVSCPGAGLVSTSPVTSVHWVPVPTRWPI